MRFGCIHQHTPATGGHRVSGVEGQVGRVTASRVSYHVREEPLPAFVWVGHGNQLPDLRRIGTRCIGMLRGEHLTKVLGVVSYRGKVQWSSQPAGLAIDDYRLAARVTIGIRGRQPGDYGCRGVRLRVHPDMGLPDRVNHTFVSSQNDN